MNETKRQDVVQGGSKIKYNMTEEHEVHVLSLAELFKLWLIDSVEQRRITGAEAERLWKQFSKDVHFVASHFSTANDAAIAAKVMADLGTSYGRVYYRTYGGKLHIIFKGNQKIRKLLTGNRYGVVNPKIVSLGIGPVGARSMLRKGGSLTIVLLSAYNIVDFVISDTQTWPDLVGQMASDLAKVAVATAVSIKTAAVMANVALVATFAVGPLVVAVIVGVGVGIVLNYIDEEFDVTKRLQRLLNRAAEEIERSFADAVSNFVGGVIDKTEEVVAGALHDIGKAAEREVKRRVKHALCGLNWCEMPWPR